MVAVRWTTAFRVINNGLSLGSVSVYGPMKEKGTYIGRIAGWNRRGSILVEWMDAWRKVHVHAPHT